MYGDGGGAATMALLAALQSSAAGGGSRCLRRGRGPCAATTSGLANGVETGTLGKSNGFLRWTCRFRKLPSITVWQELAISEIVVDHSSACTKQAKEQSSTEFPGRRARPPLHTGRLGFCTSANGIKYYRLDCRLICRL